MSRLTFRMRIALGFGAVLLIALLAGVVAYQSTYRMSGAADSIVSNTRKQNLTMEMEWSITRQSEAVRGYLLTGDAAMLDEAKEADKHFSQCADNLAAIVITPRATQLLAAIRTLHQHNTAVLERVIELRHAGRPSEALSLIEAPGTRAEQTRAISAMEELDSAADQLLRQTIEVHNRAEALTRAEIAIVVLVGLVSGTLLAFFIGRSVATPVLKFAAAVQAIAAGDLTQEDMTIGSQDEIGKAVGALNIMKQNLHGIVESLAQTAEQVAAASSGLASTSSHAASGADTQKAQAQQIASAMQEMSVTVHEISENSNRAAQSARQASETARDGGAIVQNALSSMENIAQTVRETSSKVTELGNRSDQIGRIVAVIDDIAAQTNLLALNATIEAARAGEQGRGFAVVAGEVRRLAERTAGATREINAMIEGVQEETRGAVLTMRSSTEQVERGVEVTTRAGESLSRIIAEAESVGQMVTQIAAAATQQSAATEQVTNSMTEINRLAFESADQAQNAAQSCDRLSALALELRNLVAQFETRQDRAQRERYARREPRTAAALPASALIG